MNLPVNSEAFQNFIIQSDLFELTRKSMYRCLENWYNDEPERFIQEMRATFDTMVKTYHFYNETVSITKNYNFEPVLDCITCTIRITDEEDDWCMRYKAIFDYELTIIDDVVSP